ncbi:MAG: DNA repair exonuclease [Terrimicrobiaceae bacterium]
MIRFIHSSDWQLGARFRQFGAKAEELRLARLTTLQRALSLADDRAIKIFLIAGDLFEDNQVGDGLVQQTVSLFNAFPDIQIYILPGNHDPSSGPEAVWSRCALREAPPNVHLLLEAGVMDLGGAWLVFSPLHQKVSTTDPSLKLAELAAQLPPDTIKIGITHGALAIEGKHQPNDFPIALNAASRAGLDYLAIGHWHNWLAGTDAGRIVMPGTPEPDRFSNDRSGHVACVEIDGPGNLPRVDAANVATLTWRSLSLDFLAQESSRASLEQALTDLRGDAAKTVLRITLSGSVSPQVVTEVKAGLAKSGDGFFLHQIVDATRIALTDAERADLQARHPILAQVLADIDRLEGFATGSAASAGEQTTTPLTLTEAQALLAPSKIDLARLTPEWFAQLRQTLFQTLQEVAS